MKRKTVIIIISIAFLCALVITGVVVYSKSQDPVVLFDKVIANIDKINEINSRGAVINSPTRDQLWDKTNKMLEKLGLTHYSEETIINEAFADKYLETHTKEQLLENTVKLYVFLRDQSNYSNQSSLIGVITHENWHALETVDCKCHTLTVLLNVALKKNDIEINGVNSDMLNKPGYYTENFNAEPMPFEDTHSGKFYDRDGTNVRYETKTDTGIVTYYGDYAILSVTRYAYYRGQYGWVNGEFKDVLPYWETVRFCELYYKGECIQEADTVAELLNGQSCVINIDGVLYAIKQVKVETENAYDKHIDTHIFLDISVIKRNDN